jgi:hypothetical protein
MKTNYDKSYQQYDHIVDQDEDYFDVNESESDTNTPKSSTFQNYNYSNKSNEVFNRENPY